MPKDPGCAILSRDMDLHGKVALVTGGTRGIGRAIVEALAAEGAVVILTGTREDSAVRAAQDISSTTGGEVHGRGLDVRNASQVTDLFAAIEREHGALHILVNNAGVGIFAPLADLSDDAWASVLGTNLTGVFRCCRAALPLMKRVGGGTIVNISSLAGKNPFRTGAAYNASKAGLNSFAEAMMLDHRNDNIRVSNILPGSVDTDFGGHGTGASWKIAPEDVAAVVLAVLKMPDRTMVSHVEMRPSRPPR